MREALRIGVLVCDGAAERAVSSILMDLSAVDGELSDLERMKSGKRLRTIAWRMAGVTEWRYSVENQWLQALVQSQPESGVGDRAF